MANTFGQSKANETEASENKEMIPAEKSRVTGSASDVRHGETTWRPTDEPMKSVTKDEFDEAPENRNKQFHTEMFPVTNSASKTSHGESTWRLTDEPLESVTDDEFDEAPENRLRQFQADSPGMTPKIGK